MSSYDAGALPEVTSPANPRVKRLQTLSKRRVREAAGVTLVEGYDEVALAVAAGVRPHTLYYCDALDRRADETLVTTLVQRGVEVVRLGPDAFAKASVRESPDGWLAEVPAPGVRLTDVGLSTQPLVLVCEAVEKPGNLGAMLRTADAVGADAVVAATPGTDWGNPNVVRASKGTVFTVPVAAAGTPEVLGWLREHNLQVVVATPDGHDLAGVDLVRPTAIVVGAEHAGVSDDWLSAADVQVSLPMVGTVNSLNVSVAAGVLLYDALRQRN